VKDAAKIVGATHCNIARRPAFQAVSAEEQMRLAAIAEATPRRQGQSKGAWADELKAANPNLSTKDAARIVSSTQGEIADRVAFQAVSVEEQMRLAAIAEATPRRQGQSNGAWADELKKANPGLSTEDAAKIVGSTRSNIGRRPAFKRTVSAEEQVRLAAIAEATPRQPEQSNGAWADALKAANPNLIAKDAAKIVGSTQAYIAKRAAFQAVSAEDQEGLAAIGAYDPRDEGCSAPASGGLD
ncbi:hypothetical protein ACLMJV_33130, partial [Sinorhizobium meliloti]